MLKGVAIFTTISRGSIVLATFSRKSAKRVSIIALLSELSRSAGKLRQAIELKAIASSKFFSYINNEGVKKVLKEGFEKAVFFTTKIILKNQGKSCMYSNNFSIGFSFISNTYFCASYTRKGFTISEELCA
jgi:hypothetical protein